MPSARASEFLTAIYAAQIDALRAEAFSGPVLSSSSAVLDFLSAEMAHLPVEQIRVLYLDRCNRLLRYALLAVGTIDEAPIYPREVLRQALEIGATGLILVHNHPSGHHAPSRGDREVTAALVAALSCFDIRLQDHLIISKRGHASFRRLGLL